MRVLVCGGRDYDDWPYLNYVLTNKFYKFKETSDNFGHWYFDEDLVIISGCANGADLMAIKWANANDVRVDPYPVDWSMYGKRAGYIRNKQMLTEGKPDLVIAFPGGKGTAMMCRIAKEAGVPVEYACTTGWRHNPV